MARHILSLEMPDTLNNCILPIFDTSTYTDLNAVVCPYLQITPPGYVETVNFEEPVIEPGFIKYFTACDLLMQTTGCGTTNYDLPDGIYIIRWSVSPNDIVYVEYNHLRITKALNIIQKIYCDLDLGTCDPPAAVKEKLEKLTLIQNYLKAAKAKVEYCHEPNDGMELYRYAMRLLDKMTCKNC